MVRVGCSGWQYRHWRGDFYPAGLAGTRWLDHYTTHFDTAELYNSLYRLSGRETFARWRAHSPAPAATLELTNSFYRLPERETFERCGDRTPSGFLFAVKGSPFLTHMKKLKDPKEPLHRFFEQAAGLDEKLGPVLYQLP